MDAEPRTSPEQVPPAPADRRQLTVRAVATGMVLGAILSTCNVYAG